MLTTPAASGASGPTTVGTPSFSAKSASATGSVMFDVLQFMSCRAGVAGGDEDLLQAGGLGRGARPGMLAAAGTDDEEFHAAFLKNAPHKR